MGVQEDRAQSIQYVNEDKINQHNAQINSGLIYD